MWQCNACGYVWDGEEAPEQCPKCGAGHAKFTQLDDKAADLIERARYTNSLHMQIYALMEEVMAIAEEGLDDNLDAGCTKIFEQTLVQAEFVQQAIKAELQGHMKKGKWG
ncbi:MAG: rubredoxin [Anaerolineae bacterium]|jgi:predicted  nucleic acid-binding Zn-ribbon protein|nr:rubredoxin [Anaerolineae bacterium]